MAKKAKSLKYWDRQFDEALPIFLAKWYVASNISRVEQLCEKEGVESLVKFTHGFYSSEKVGEWVVWHARVVDGIVDQLRVDQANPLGVTAALFGRIDFYQQSLTKGHDTAYRRIKLTFGQIKELGWPPKLAEALISTFGQAIQDTQWWKGNIQEIRKQSRAVSAVKKVMKS